ncbi:hypothetical protein [Candidatus Marithrix sp. Canyon 246]|uniref:hypothetical protein n=1 Tax=Candidatus Marithrix sp. Canyon 246 TaxID=1827136 RepID=UPI000849FAFA|nr:hypothetical protein [Candidatus Marithrix sp. Canyon 246]
MKQLLQLLLIIILLCTQSPAIKAEGLLRLFTTPAQREALDAARAKPIIKKPKRKKRVKKRVKKRKKVTKRKKRRIKIKKPKKRKSAKKIKRKKRIRKPKKLKPKIAKKKPIKVIKPKKTIQKPPVKIKKIEQPKIEPKKPIKVTKPKKIEIPKPKLPRYISFEGLMTRSDGTTTIWINGTNDLYREGFTIEIDKIKPDYSIPIILNYTKQRIILKPGQNYDTLERKIKESYMIQK